MPAWKGKSKGKPLGYKIFVSILKGAGIPTAYFVLRFVAFYYLVFSFKSTKHTFIYFHKRHGYGILKSVYKVYRNYNMLGQSLIDKIAVVSDIKNRLTFELDGVSNLRKIAAQDTGGLLLTAHIGNWEAASHLLTDIDARINIVTFDGEEQGIKEYLESVTGKSRLNFIQIKEDMSHIFKMSEAFLDKELVCLPADRFLEGSKTVAVNFLGAEAKFPLGPFLLPDKFKVPVTFVYGMKESKYHYHFFSSDIKEYPGTASEGVSEQILRDYVDYMEEKVKKYPEQWYNYYNFWQQ